MRQKNPSAQRHQQPAKKLRLDAGRKKLPSLVGHFVAFLILVFASLAENKPSTPENTQEQGYHKIFSPNFWYEEAVGKPQPPARYVTVIMLGTDIPGTIEKASLSGSREIQSACKRRIYIAQLLKALSKFAPKVVVLDMWFDPANCPQSDSPVLWDELDQFSSQIPIVSGIGSYNPSEMLSSMPAEYADAKNRKPGLKPTELVLAPRIEPGHPLNAKITEGVVEMNADYRKIPLSWPVYDTFASVGLPGQPYRVDSLAVAGVRAFDPTSAILGRVGALKADGAGNVSTELHPYTSFLRVEDFPVIRAIDVVCSGTVDDFWQGECDSIGRRSLNPQMVFEGRIVLVGIENVKDDTHQSLLGNVPGVMLQANFIESLLQGRVYKPLATTWQITIGIAWIFVVSWMTWRFASHPSVAFLLSLATVIVSAYLIRLAFAHFHYYADLIVPLILATLVLNITRWIESFLAHPEAKT